MPERMFKLDLSRFEIGIARTLKRLERADGAMMDSIALETIQAVDEQREKGIDPHTGNIQLYEPSTAKRKGYNIVDKKVTREYRRAFLVKRRTSTKIVIGEKGARNIMLADIFNRRGLRTKHGKKLLPDVGLTRDNRARVLNAGSDAFHRRFKGVI